MFKAHIVKGFWKGLNYGGMNLEMKKNVKFTPLNFFKSLDSDSKNGLGPANFGPM
jgi:hypothetical protein